MSAILLALVASVTVSPAHGSEGPPAGLTNARLEVRALSGPLGQAVRSTGAGPSWIGYVVPSIRHGHMCCYDSIHESRMRPRGCCRLEGRAGGVNIQSEGRDDDATRATPLSAESAPPAVVMLRVEKGQVGRLGVYSSDCGLDAGGLPVLWLTGVPVGQSLAFLEPLVAQGEDALVVIAAHAGADADALLERQAAPGRSRKVREQAAFWLGESRGQRGYEVLRRLLREDADARFREHVVFALSESDVPAATDAIIEAARRDADSEVRGQALFWLAQKAGRQAAAAITRAIEEDPETEVKKKAVFALSELPDGEGVPLLIRLARENRNPAVREQAFFWLGQSEDPRALEFIATVLKR
jgi:HEAT repeats